MTSIASFSGLASGIQWRDMIDQIMKLESSRRLSPVTGQIKLQEQRKSAWGEYGGLVAKLRDASKAFSDGSAFSAFKTSATPSAATGRALVSATANDKASPGSYRVQVLQLAQAEKLGSAAVADAAAALGLAGTFHVNGRAVALEASDSLSSLRDKINSANTGGRASGVTATILSTSATSHRLILTADGTGSRGVELTDSTSGVLKDAKLGILAGTRSANASTEEIGWTDSIRYSSRSEVLKDVLGLSPPPAVSSITVGGTQVQIDFNSDTLDAVLAKIKAADPLAKMREELVNGKKMYRLSTSKAVATHVGSPESQRVIDLLGFSRESAASQIAAGSDARFQVDGYDLTRRTNTVTDAIAGVTLNLLAAEPGARSFQVTGANLSIVRESADTPSGTYAISLQAQNQTSRTATSDDPDLSVATNPGVPDGKYAVQLTTGVQRSTSASNPALSVLSAPAATQPGTYAVNITQAATRGGVQGGTAATSYAGLTGDFFKIKDDRTGVERQYNLTLGQSLDSVVAGLNGMFTGNSMRIVASNEGGYLKIAHMDFGSSDGVVVNTNNARVNTAYGLANATYRGLDVRGTIGGEGSTGVGQTLTGGGGLVKDLQISYSGTAIGAVGTVTVADQTVVTGGTIGGHASTWNAGTGTLTANSGTTLAGLAVRYTGPVVAGLAGNVTLASAVEYAITGATIGGETAVWDAATRSVRGASGSRFAGLELSYTGPVTGGKIGDLTVEGEDASVELRIDRDADATTKKVEEFAELYNKMAEFAKRQRDAKGPLGGDGSLRTMVSSLRDVLFSEASGLSASNPYSRLTLVGVEFTRSGTLKVNASAFGKALAEGAADVKELFAGVGAMMKTAADALADSAEGSIKIYQENLTSSISSLGLRELDVQAQLDRRRTDLVKQFTRMEEAMSRIQSQSNSLASQILSLNPR